MSYSTKYLPKIASMVAAIAITLGVQSLLVIGFDQMARESQICADTSQVAISPSTVVVHGRS
jgi:hypothetical protein